MKNPIIRKGLYILAGLVMFVLNANYASAQILPECTKSGRCTICDMVQTGINIGVFVLGIIGAVTFMIIVYGGLMMLISGGRSDYIKKGKDVLINAVVGLAIALLAYGVVNTVVAVVTEGGWSWEPNLKCAELPSPTQYTAPNYGSFLPDTSSNSGGQPTSDKDEKITPNPGGWPNGTDCEDKTQCESGFCYEFSEIDPTNKNPDEATIDAANNSKGKCLPTSFIKEGSVCEDANIDNKGVAGAAGDDNIPCPTGLSCKDPGAGEWGICKSSAANTPCNDKGECSTGVCYDFFTKPDGKIDPDDENGLCIKLPLKRGDICEDANVVAYSADEDLPCPAGMTCKDKGAGMLGRCEPKDNGTFCFDESQCSSGLCWEWGDPPVINWPGPTWMLTTGGRVFNTYDAPNDDNDDIGICKQSPLSIGETCDDGNVDAGASLGDPDAACGVGAKCPSGLTQGKCCLIANCP